MQKRIYQMGPRGPHAIFPPDHLFVNEHRGEIIVIHAPPPSSPLDQLFVNECRGAIIVIHALPPPVFTTSLLMNTGVRYYYIIHLEL